MTDIDYQELLLARKTYATEAQTMTDMVYDIKLKNYLESSQCTPEQRKVLTGLYDVEADAEDESQYSIDSYDNLNAILELLLKNVNVKLSVKIDGIRLNITYILTDASQYLYTLAKVTKRNSKIEVHPDIVQKFPKSIIIKGCKRKFFKTTAECYVLEKDLEQISFFKRHQYKSALNAANSIASTGIGLGDKSLIKCAVHHMFLGAKNKEVEMILAKRLGMLTVPYAIVSPNNIENTIGELRNMAVKETIPTDGIVIEVNDNEHTELTGTGSRVTFLNTFAYKPTKWISNEYIGTVADIKFENAGYQYNAKIVIEPYLTKEGKTVTEVNAHTPSNIFSNNIEIGDKITFEIKSNNYIEFKNKI